MNTLMPDVQRNFRRMAMIPVYAIVLIVVLVASFGSFYTVDQGDRVVLLRTGRIVSVEEPGLHLKLPIVDNPVPISTRQMTFRPASKFEVYSYDQQVAELKISITYHVPPPGSRRL